MDNITDEICEKGNWDDYRLYYNYKNIPVELLEKYIDKINWEFLSRYVNIPLEFLEKHLDQLNWFDLSFNKNIPLEFFERHLDKVNNYGDELYNGWNGLWIKDDLTVEFCEKHLDKIIWEWLCQNDNIPPEFFERHLDKVNKPDYPNWFWLSLNRNIPVEFLERNQDKASWELMSNDENFISTRASWKNYDNIHSKIPNIDKVLNAIADSICGDTSSIISSNSTY